MAGPLEQFEIQRIIPIEVAGLDISITNSAVMMAIGVLASAWLMIRGMERRALIPDRLQSMAEMAYEFIAGMVHDNAGREGLPYLPFVFCIFMTVFLGNMLGMIPYSFTTTSHIIVTGTLAMIVIVTVTLIGLVKHGTHFFSLFMPHGAPVWLAPIIVPIEVVSYLSRPVSLSIRLFANMMAGHTMMKVFAGFTVSLIASLGVGGMLVGVAPIALNVALIGFELLVAFLQAYVFTILTCLYLNDALHLH